MFDIKENLKKLPDSPGVYMHKDKLGQIIYVGKAVSLKNRVRQYFQSSKNQDAKVRSMVSQIEEFEYITTGSEMEALILECNLIKKHQPKYNVLLRDDKTYPYIKITAEEYPRILKTRIVKKDGGRYFGPYSDAGAVNQTVDVLNSAYSLKRCNYQSFPVHHKPCLNYHIHQCSGVCRGNVSRAKYLERIELAADFLRGKNRELESYLSGKMNEASESLDYERAAEYRDYILALRALTEKQRVVMSLDQDIDLIMTTSGSSERYIVLFFVRGGKLSGRETYQMAQSEEEPPEMLVSEFIKQHYQDQHVPQEILVDKMPCEAELLMQYLTELSGRNVAITVPQRGEKRALLALAKKDVVEMTKSVDDRAENRKAREEAVSEGLSQVLRQMGRDCGRKQYRVEAYDISNTNGVDTVGAMVVFEGLTPVRKDYRRFKVRTIEGPNDYGSMQEVLIRRLMRAKEDDSGFNKLPDMLLIDGGKGHVTAAMTAVKATGLDIPVIGMAKDDHHRTKELVYFTNDALANYPLKGDPMMFQYMGAVQEEVHRFAIEYHKKLRGRHMTVSVLDEIEGIGPVRRNALLAEFGSVENIKAADKEELMERGKLPERVADSVLEFFA